MRRSIRLRVAGAGLMAMASVVAGGSPATAHPDAGPYHCWYSGELHGEADCRERADADWEGLSSEEQDAIRATGLTGTRLDQLVIDFRQAKLDASGCGRAEPGRV